MILSASPYWIQLPIADVVSKLPLFDFQCISLLDVAPNGAMLRGGETAVSPWWRQCFEAASGQPPQATQQPSCPAHTEPTEWESAVAFAIDGPSRARRLAAIAARDQTNIEDTRRKLDSPKSSQIQKSSFEIVSDSRSRTSSHNSFASLPSDNRSLARVLALLVFS